jgi:hypothetical protein
MSRKNLLSLHEAIVVALINLPTRTANFDEIAAFIESRNLFPERKGNTPLAKQVMLRSTKAKGAYKYLFHEIGAGYIKLRNTIEPLQIWNDLEGLLEYDRQFYNPDAKEISFVSAGSQFKETIKLKVSPADVICITAEEKGRRKKFFIREHTAKGEVVKCYLFNNNKYSFDTLCKYLDPIEGYLSVISKSALVNVNFYDLENKANLKYNRKLSPNEVPETIKISASTKINSFKNIKTAFTRRILLQKAAIGYKNDLSS